MANNATRNKVGTWAGFLFILVWCLLPVVWIISLSFKGPTETAAGSPQFLPKEPTLQNYTDIFNNSDFRDSLVNSFGIAAISTFLSVILATLAAYAIARLEFKGKKLVLSIALAIAMFPVVALVGPLFDLWRTLGLFNTWPGLIIPYMSFTLPLAIWTLSAFFREIPWEMEQAAQVDGATSWQAFRKVIVPLAAPGVFTAAILTFFFAWNEFVLALSLTSTTASRTVPAQLSYFVGPDPFNPPYGQLATASVVVTVPIIIIVLLFQRKIVAGLTSGAVKG
jgi:trehalose/maltose transport system permease protein